MIDDSPMPHIHYVYSTNHDAYLLTSQDEQKPFLDGTFNCIDKPRSPLPVEAPIQPRRYLTPSVTSRKDLPAHFARQLSRCPALNRKSSEDEQDQLAEDGIGALDQDLVEQIQEKRRRNTLSARKSRQRKMQQMRDLEQERDELLTLVHDYRKYVLEMHKYLESQGLNYELPTFCRK